VWSRNACLPSLGRIIGYFDLKPPSHWSEPVICKCVLETVRAGRIHNFLLTYFHPFICRFGDEYATLKARVLKTLCDAAGLDKALATQYGGIVAISLFGPKAIDAFLLPLAVDYWKRWEAELDQSSDLKYRLELQMCKQAVLVRLWT
jgi:hypothetical protein